MKAIIPSLAIAFYTLFFNTHAEVLPSEPKALSIIEISNEDPEPNSSGLEFSIRNSSINTKYSEFSSGIFRGKLIVVSSKKIGGLGNGNDPETDEPFTELFCMDVDEQGKLSNPLLFSRILNTKHNEGQLSFSPDENTVYFTRSLRSNSKNYQLYRAELEPDSHGNWIKITQITQNSFYSIENPHVSRDGKTLYFSSNKSGGYGGFDLYKAEIKANGDIGLPQNLGPEVNTAANEKHPWESHEGRILYFSSDGQPGFGGYDLFMTHIFQDGYDEPKNLGYGVNSKSDDLALTFINDELGYFSSNRGGGKGSFDLYEFKAEPVMQVLQGIIVDADTKKPLPQTEIVLLDKGGFKLGQTITGIDAHFRFDVIANNEYQIKIVKPGFDPTVIDFIADDNGSEITYKQVLELQALPTLSLKKKK